MHAFSAYGGFQNWNGTCEFRAWSQGKTRIPLHRKSNHSSL